ncbi:hypothetical protein EV193_1011092 [Herbihabitans rhizosphaerae]|uniref:Uncharacterized protein n=1 Tax=Herbihabitans rhizosphaerae TaxID=1872711 RepID=A0A4Q7L743_9PSEU|nr:hypothetical protein [Herbihabitans rhizosphaerae]RZS45205.1 hypothetical protein EV193_1011092 [Herbihabitans rhizosphaerae]
MTNDHAGLPEPFLGEDGFPLVLRHIRAEVESRGGRIEGTGLAWRLTHPDLPDLAVEFTEDGEVIIDAGDGAGLDVHCDAAWRIGPAERPWAHVEDVLLAFLEGGFTYTTWTDERGEIRKWRIRLVGSHHDEAGGLGVPTDDSWTAAESRYPAWPGASSQTSRG